MDNTNILYGKKWAVCGDSIQMEIFLEDIARHLKMVRLPENIRHMVI